MQQRPQNVTDVLCREVGASHPDGALRQIRTMKRVLRMHYRSQKKLERFGVDDCMEAVACISDLRGLLRKARSLHRKQAQANIQTVDEAIALLRESMQQLRDSARPAEALPQPETTSPLDVSPGRSDDATAAGATPDGATPDGAMQSDAASPGARSPTQAENVEHRLQSRNGTADAGFGTGDPAAVADASLSTLDAFETVAAQLDELRLELWIGTGSAEACENDSSPVEDTLSDADPILNQVEEMMQSLKEQNRSLRQSCENLQARNHHLSARLQRCQRRIDNLERQGPT